MTGLSAISTVLAPFLFLLVPGLAFAPYFQGKGIAKVVRIFICSVSVMIVLLMGAALLGLPNYYLIAAAAGFSVLAILARWRSITPVRVMAAGIYAIIVLACVTVLAIPFFLLYHGLPTGDSQKALYWSQQINEAHTLPNYQEAIAHLNRDPVDFYTPGLHALTAGVLRVTPHPLLAVGYFALILTVVAACIAAALASQLFSNQPRGMQIFGLAVILLGNIRFLRYVREPGYHYQNIVGEVLLFGVVLLAVSLVQRWHWPDFFLACLASAALLLTHQFSAFVGLFVLLPYAVALFVKHFGSHLRQNAKVRNAVCFGSLGALLLAALVAGLTGLDEKVPHLFTLQPHLLELTPSLAEYVTLLGALWIFIALGGMALALATEQLRSRLDVLAFLASTAMIGMLSQAPRLGIDIPPVRALFYSAIPFAVWGSYFLTRLWYARATSPHQPWVRRTLLTSLLLVTVLPTVTAAVTPTLGVRTNSTYLPEYTTLNEYLTAQSGGAVLVDDYNRRSATWLILSGHPMYARLASELAQQMKEARQSSLRYNVYTEQLNYEKVFSLGSLPEIAALLEAKNIRWVTGIANSSAAAFAHNPALLPRVQAKDITLYEVQPLQVPPSTLATWLLRPSTLANDIGDPEDTFAHLPVSVRSPRLSEPQFLNGRTVRTTTSPLIPVHFNVSDYVDVLWNQENQPHPDSALEFFLRLANGATPLILETPAGTHVPLTPVETLVRLEADEFLYDQEGNLTLLLHNPTEQSISLDVVALGPARVP